MCILSGLCLCMHASTHWLCPLMYLVHIVMYVIGTPVPAITMALLCPLKHTVHKTATDIQDSLKVPSQWRRVSSAPMHSSPLQSWDLTGRSPALPLCIALKLFHNTPFPLRIAISTSWTFSETRHSWYASLHGPHPFSDWRTFSLSVMVCVQPLWKQKITLQDKLLQVTKLSLNHSAFPTQEPSQPLHHVTSPTYSPHQCNCSAHHQQLPPLICYTSPWSSCHPVAILHIFSCSSLA